MKRPSVGRPMGVEESQFGHLKRHTGTYTHLPGAAAIRHASPGYKPGHSDIAS